MYRVKDSWNFGWSVITLSSKKCIRCQGSLQIDGGCVVQDVKERIASRTYTKKKKKKKIEIIIIIIIHRITDSVNSNPVKW